MNKEEEKEAKRRKHKVVDFSLSFLHKQQYYYIIIKNKIDNNKLFLSFFNKSKNTQNKKN